MLCTCVYAQDPTGGVGSLLLSHQLKLVKLCIDMLKFLLSLSKVSIGNSGTIRAS